MEAQNKGADQVEANTNPEQDAQPTQVAPDNPPKFGEDYDEAPDAKEDDADFNSDEDTTELDAAQDNGKEDSK